MKIIDFYNKTLGLKTKDEIFDYLVGSLKPSIATWSYFVNWEKVFENTKKLEVGLNTLNYLIGKKDFDKEFKFLVKSHPEILEVVPTLIVRDGSGTLAFKILVDYKNKKFVYENYDFGKSNPTDADIENYLKFAEETGIKDLILSQKIKNLVDYMIGVEAGLDSNGRKNRGGIAMESIIDFFIKDVCSKNGFQYLKEANAASIKEAWNYDVPVDKSSRRYDFVVNNGKELFIFETNFYSSGGSKLKSTAGEYRNLFDVLDSKYKFIWITDGEGWKKTTWPLRETFDNNDYIFNLDMVEKGILEALLIG
jgi:type II restriction enzyme